MADSFSALFADYLWLKPALAGIFGAIIGSFLNVCIYRIPAGLSIIHPGSSCPRCQQMIPFYDNFGMRVR
jgi:leader peptidase (prepilin peptidase)/N-methyltransferase